MSTEAGQDLESEKKKYIYIYIYINLRSIYVFSPAECPNWTVEERQHKYSH